MRRERKEKKKMFSTKSCGSVLWIKIKSCMLGRWHMSSRIGMKVELINRVLNVFHTQRSTLRRLQRIYSRITSLGRIVRVDDDACVHGCGPALRRIVVPIRRTLIFGGGGGKRRWGMRGPNAVLVRRAGERDG